MSARELLRLAFQDISLSIFGSIPRLPPHVGPPDPTKIFWRPVAGAAADQPSVLLGLNATHLSAAGRVGSDLQEIRGEHAPPVLFEHMSYDVFIEWLDGIDPVTVSATATAALAAGREAASGGRRSRHYRLSLRDDVGLLTVLLHRGHSPDRLLVGSLQIEVAPRKLDYRRDYVAITSDLSDIMPGLTLSSAGRTSVRAGAAATSRQVAMHWYEMFRGIALELLGVVDRLALDPQRRLEPRERWVPSDRARRVSPSSFERAIRSMKKTMVLSVDGFAMEVPARLPELATVHDYDAEGNRFIRWLLLEVYSRLQHLREELTGARWNQSEGLKQVAARWREEIEVVRPQAAARLRYDWLARAGSYQGGSLSANLQAHPLYSRAFILGRSLLRGLSTATSDLTDAGTKSISLVYEYWCFLKLAELLRVRGDLEELRGPVFDVNHGAISLRPGARSAARFRHLATGHGLVLAYNRRFDTATFVQKPDVMLKIEGQRGWHAFDAKYRLDFSPNYRRSFGGVGPRREDVAAMHRYRDAVRGTNGKRLILTACVLFPWNDEVGYAGSHRFHASIRSSGIGGLPFLPSATDLVAEWLDSILTSRRGTPAGAVPV